MATFEELVSDTIRQRVFWVQVSICRGNEKGLGIGCYQFETRNNEILLLVQGLWPFKSNSGTCSIMDPFNASPLGILEENHTLENCIRYWHTSSHWWGYTISPLWPLCSHFGGCWFVWHYFWICFGGKGRIRVLGNCRVWEETCVLSPLQDDRTFHSAM